MCCCADSREATSQQIANPVAGNSAKWGAAISTVTTNNNAAPPPIDEQSLVSALRSLQAENVELKVSMVQMLVIDRNSFDQVSAYAFMLCAYIWLICVFIVCIRVGKNTSGCLGMSAMISECRAMD